MNACTSMLKLFKFILLNNTQFHHLIVIGSLCNIYFVNKIFEKNLKFFCYFNVTIPQKHSFSAMSMETDFRQQL